MPASTRSAYVDAHPPREACKPVRAKCILSHLLQPARRRMSGRRVEQRHHRDSRQDLAAGGWRTGLLLVQTTSTLHERPSDSRQEPDAGGWRTVPSLARMASILHRPPSDSCLLLAAGGGHTGTCWAVILQLALAGCARGSHDLAWQPHYPFIPTAPLMEKGKSSTSPVQVGAATHTHLRI